MIIVAGLGSVDDYLPFVEAGAGELFIGYVPLQWREQAPYDSLNRREVRFYNVQIGSMSELLILRDMVRDAGVPVTIALNALDFTPEQRSLIVSMVRECADLGYEDYIVADGALAELLCQHRVHLSGEYGELNHLILADMKSMGVTRIIFPRQTKVEEMESMIQRFPDFEYEAFLLNEKCHYTGAYCNSLHCDELCHACRIPYRLFAEEGEIPGYNRPGYEEDHEDFSVPGESGCGLCRLWKYRQIGITHLKLVSRGNDTESTLEDLSAIRTALEILEQAPDEQSYIRKMKEMIFPDGCSGNCY
ncbi:MAG: U32 family peptidase [Lachnospiraceae bacterium]|nr:U32 family peptidase [Lachnospiraceae bacterium]